MSEPTKYIAFDVSDEVETRTLCVPFTAEFLKILRNCQAIASSIHDQSKTFLEPDAACKQLQFKLTGLIALADTIWVHDTVSQANRFFEGEGVVVSASDLAGVAQREIDVALLEVQWNTINGVDDELFFFVYVDFEDSGFHEVSYSNNGRSWDQLDEWERLLKELTGE